MICVLISEFLPTPSFLVFHISSKKNFHIYKMHLLSNSHMLFVTSKSTKEISPGNYLQIYQGSKTLSTFLNPWAEQLSLDNSVETADGVWTQESTACLRERGEWMCVCRSRRKSTETRWMSVLRRHSQCFQAWLQVVLFSLVALPQNSQEWLEKWFSRGGSLPLCTFPVWPVRSWLPGSNPSRFHSSQNVCLGWAFLSPEETWGFGAWTAYKKPQVPYVHPLCFLSTPVELVVSSSRWLFPVLSLLEARASP